VLLAIDTSAGTGVAVVDGERVLAEHTSADTRRHAEVIGALIAAALADAGVTPADLTGVAAGMGPGPFTGLRVGVVAARTFAFGAGLPLLPVVSHDAIAVGAHIAGPVMVTTDARRRERYWSAYAGLDDDRLPMRTSGPALAKPDDLPAGLARLDDAAVAPGALGVLAARTLAAGRAFALDEALYLRSPDVTMSAANTGGRRVS
jgi:tRNA threonylcarbamoyl adenosine modification protein YeaZ